MKTHINYHGTGPGSQRGVSLIVALVMLIVLTLIGVSSMNTAVVELKMAGSSQQQSIALNRADELLAVGEAEVIDIVTTAGTFDFSADGDGYYTTADAINVQTTDWATAGLNTLQGDNPNDTYVIEYLGIKGIPGETRKDGGDPIFGAAVHTFRITSRSEAGKGSLRLVQSIYVSTSEP